MRALVHISHIWFVSGNFGVALKLVQGIVYPKEALSGFAFCAESADEGAEKETTEEEEEEEEVVEIEVSDDESEE